MHEQDHGVGLERLADAIERIAREHRPERLCLAVLDAAMALTGARAGRVTGPVGGGRTGLLAMEGAHGDEPPLSVPLDGDGREVGRLDVWGVEADPVTTAALRVLAAHCSAQLGLAGMRRVREDDRRRARRLSAAAERLRGADDARTAITMALADARAVTGAPAAVLAAAGSTRLESAACDGVADLTEAELALLVPPERRPSIAEGRVWRGALDPDGPLGARGFGAVAVAGLGERAGLGFLCALAADAAGLADADVEALGQLAGHVAGALTTVVLQREVRDLGTVDPLTRFFNLRYFRTRLEQECLRARRTGRAVSVAVMSLDGLGAVRADGRAGAGDAAMQALCAQVTARLRGMDVGCRVGEDELATILPEVEGIDALRVGERLRASLRDDPVLANAFTLSVGVASFPSQAGDATSLHANARSAMVWARAHGGDRTFLYEREAAAILSAEEAQRNADEESLLATLLALADSVDGWHPATVGHGANVGRLAGLIAAEMGLPAAHADRIALAGRLHDLGKSGMRRDLVVGPPATAADAEALRRHPEIGERMLAGCTLADMGPWLRHHHERIDGAGYPAGLTGEDIPLEARIIAAANRFDRLVGGTPAAPPIPADEAIELLEDGAGIELDAGAVAALAALVRRGIPVRAVAQDLP